MSAIEYRPELDGLRAVAVVPVILFHFENALLPGGYIGVDVFFVISGFLITSIILDECRREVFSFRDFWLRRVRRILPALILMVSVTLLVGSFVIYAPDINNLGAQGMAALLSYANISHWLMVGNYWGHEAESSPLLHTWSLSVEEQFYLIFPLVLYLVFKYFRDHLLWIFALAIVMSLALFFVGVHTHPSATFYLLPTRAWELGAGALLAIYRSRHGRGRVVSSHWPLVGLILILVSYFLVHDEEGISPFLVIPVVGAALVVYFQGAEGSFVQGLLSSRPFVYVGKISYSLYLWHWPILVFTQQVELKQGVDLHPFLLFGSIFLIAVLSYHWVERPLRRNVRWTPFIFLALFVGVTYAATLKGRDCSEDISAFEPTRWYGELYDVTPVLERPESIRRRMRGIEVMERPKEVLDAYKEGGIIKRYGSARPEVVVLGDSHAVMWSKVLDEIAEELSVSISFYGANGTPAFFKIPPQKGMRGDRFFDAQEKYLFDQARLKYLQAWKPKVVIIASRWSKVKSRSTVDLIRYIQKLGSQLLLIEQPPELFFGDKNAPQYLSYLGLATAGPGRKYIRHLDRGDYARGRALVQSIVDGGEGRAKVPVADLFLEGDRVLVIEDGRVLYIDDDHLSHAGTLKVKERLRAALARLLHQDPKSSRRDLLSDRSSGR